MAVVMTITTQEIHIRKVKQLIILLMLNIIFKIVIPYFFFLDNSQSGGGRGWKNYNTGGSSGPSKPTGNQGSRYGGRNAPYTRQK